VNLPPARRYIVALLSASLLPILTPVTTSAGNRVVAWGSNTYAITNAPAAATNVIAIAAGQSFSLALKADGTVLAWGASGFTNVPAGLSNVVAIAAGGGQSLALKEDGSLIAWGFPHTSATTNIPAGLTNIVAIAAGNTGNLAIKADGTAWGSGNFTNHLTGYSNHVSGTLVANGNSQGAVLRSDSSALIWGYPNPNSTTTNLPDVIALVGRSAFNQAGALWALRRDGTLTGFGSIYLGQTNVYQNLSNVLAVAVGYGHHVAIVGDGFPLPIAPLSQASFSNRRFTIQQPTIRGRSYILEYQDADATNGWQQLPPVPGTGQTNTLTDPNATTTARYYRVRVSP